ncbi:MAG: 5-formyltetrahydrofolate cyclo-ligase [Pseudomonadota bacterium]
MTLSSTDQKAALRREKLKLRNGLAEEMRIAAAFDLADRAKAVFEDDFMPGTIVAGYHPIRSELDPRPLMAVLADLGARLCLPVVTGETTMEFRELLRGGTLSDSGFGTIGPDETAAVMDPEVLLVPLSVFDTKGGRIGYGAGFYDRAIEKLENKGQEPTLIGIAFDEQQADFVPMERHDRRLGTILTPTRTIKAE